MIKPFGKFNSKGFLIAYLAVVMILLALWHFKWDRPAEDHRNIPAVLKPFLFSPPQVLPQILLQGENDQLLTNAMLQQKWSWLYFAQPHCLPACGTILTVLHNLQHTFAATDNQFLLMDFHPSKTVKLADLIQTMNMDFPVYGGDLTALMETLDFLYLTTVDNQGREQVEQYHYLYLIDPKGRAYAVFKPPFTSVQLQQTFLLLRDFYARSE